MKRCLNCNGLMPADAAKCIQCGTDAGGAQSAESDAIRKPGGWLSKMKLTRILAVVLTSKLFFRASCTGMLLTRLGVDGVESGQRHGNQVRPIDPYMAVVATIPDSARPGQRTLVETGLSELEKFKKENPGYSFLVPAGKGAFGARDSIRRTEYEVSAAGTGKVHVETRYHNDEIHVLGRYAATDKEIEPAYTKSSHDFADFINAMAFALPFALLLAVAGHLLGWYAGRAERGAAAKGG